MCRRDGVFQSMVVNEFESATRKFVFPCQGNQIPSVLTPYPYVYTERY